MKLPEPYRLADQYLERLSKLILRRTEKTRKKLSLLKFDDLSVMQEIDVLYEVIGRDCKQAFRRLYADRYREIYRYLKGKEPDDDEIDELLDMYLAGLWDDPNENTHYAFGTELDRKRDRAKEAIIAVPTRTQKQLELAKAVRYLIQQSAWYIDFTSQDAEIQAFEDCGIKKVKRHEMKDEKVCPECRKADGEVYDIDNIPELPHLRCRRWFTPITR